MSSRLGPGALALVAVLLGLLAPLPAEAGACCVGSTTTLPTRLGPCENWLVAGGVSGETTLGRWDRSGALRTTSLEERALVGNLAGAWRWDRKGQIAVSAPLRLNHKVLGEQRALGGGLGDARVVATWEPVQERMSLDGPMPPVPVLAFGARLPTGRDWHHSQDPLHADVTGLEAPALIVGLMFERTMDRTPWLLSVDTETGFGGHGVQPTVHLTGGIGRYLSHRLSLLGTVRHTQAWMPGHGGHTARTAAGLRLTHGQMMAWRGWMGADLDLPVPGLGRSAPQELRLALGVALVR